MAPLTAGLVDGLVTTIVMTALGLVYGIVLMIGGMLFWMRTVIGMAPDRGPEFPRTRDRHLCFRPLT